MKALTYIEHGKFALLDKPKPSSSKAYNRRKSQNWKRELPPTVLRLFLSRHSPSGGYSSSGCWPSWASHLHSVSSILVNTALKEESSGEQA